MNTVRLSAWSPCPPGKTKGRMLFRSLAKRGEALLGAETHAWLPQRLIDELEGGVI
jgi:hypothetical protein